MYIETSIESSGSMEYSPSIMAIQEGVYGIKIIEKHKTDVVVELAEINTISVSVLLIAFFLVFGRWNTKKFLFGTNNGRWTRDRRFRKELLPLYIC